MKIEHSKINDLRSVIEYFITGIKEAAAMGGDVLENIQGQCDDCSRQVNEWYALNMMPAEKEAAPDRAHYYLDHAVIAGKKNHEDMDLYDFKCIVMSDLYRFVKRSIREQKDDMPGPAAGRMDIFNWVDELLHKMPGITEYQKHYTYSIIDVCDDVVNDIMEHRKQNKQLEFFKP